MPEFRTNKKTGKVHPITPAMGKSYSSLSSRTRGTRGTARSSRIGSSRVGGQGMSYEEAQRRHRDGRSLHAQVIDEALVAHDQTPKEAEDFSHWAGEMNRRDAEGIDVGNIGPGSTRKTGTHRWHGETTPPPGEDKELPGDHPITLVGGEEAIKQYQPIMDKRFKDLKDHPKTQERFNPVAGDSSYILMSDEEKKAAVLKEDKTKIALQVGEAGAGVAGYYESKFDPRIDPSTNREAYEKSRIPYRIVIDDDYHKGPSAEETFTHEAIHLRRNVQKDAKLKKLLNDKDSEEKETVHETSARMGEEGIKRTPNPGYYQHVPGAYPKVRIEDLKILGLHSAEGKFDTNEIETHIQAYGGKTELNKHKIADVSSDKERVAAKKASLIDTTYITSEGDVVHAYSPKGNINPKKFARRVDKMDGKVGEESVYRVENGKKELLIKKKPGVKAG